MYKAPTSFLAWTLKFIFSLTAFPLSAVAQTWPNKPIKIVAPFPPGGSVDQVSRILAQQLTLQTGQPVIVENRGGGSGSIGTGVVAKSAPDGYTFVVVFDTHAVNPSLIPNMPFDTVKDLSPIMLIGTSPMVLVAHKDSPYKNFGDVVKAAKDSKGSVQYGSISSGSLAHLAMTQLAATAKTEFTHVPYKGGGPLMQDAIAGHIRLSMGSAFLVALHVASGRVRPIAVTSAKRYVKYPDVPTIAESGYKGFDAPAWWGILAPAGMPLSLKAQMHN